MRTAVYLEVEEALVSWLKYARSQNVPISVPILQTKAEKLAAKLGFDDFKCSTGWLSRSKERHDIVFKTVSGESAVVDGNVVASWKDNLGNLIQDHKTKDVLNVDRTGIFFKLLPEKTLVFKGDECSGGKKSKERITALAAANMNVCASYVCL